MSKMVIHIIHYPGRHKMHCGKPLGTLYWSRNKDEVTCMGCLKYIGVQKKREDNRKKRKIIIGCKGKIHFGFIHKLKNNIKYCNFPVGESTRNISEVTCKSCLKNIEADLKKAKKNVRVSKRGEKQ